VSDITRVHIELPDEVHHDAKVAAARRGITLKAWVTEAIEEKVVREEEPDQPARPKR
jgi:predicted HicB family RNase H-like nuclease